MNVLYAGLIACILGLAACTPEQTAKTCSVGALANAAVEAGRGGDAERRYNAELKAWCASKGHVY